MAVPRPSPGRQHPAGAEQLDPETSNLDRARPEKAGGGGLRVGQMSDFVFDSELLALKLGDQGLIRVRPAFLFEDQVFEVLVLGLERFDMLRSGHLEPSLRTRFVTV
jgi:hypothetical protein